MKRSRDFSSSRLVAMIVKEFTQMRRDRLTFGMVLGIPLLQLVLFGFAINSDPKHLPTAVLLTDDGPHGRTLLYAIKNSGYFDFVHAVSTEAEAEAALAQGEVQFLINIPANFSRDLIRGARPAILVEADATDPATTGNALGSLRMLLDNALRNDFKGPLDFLLPTEGPID
ncbi:MAG TPA: ABC transporter permease, partial [Candidatus Acidoferrum sp.]|nr:ABC transporter permease [Candidatus Acidoferrum sp.]